MKKFTVASLFLLLSILANSQGFRLHPAISEPSKKLSLTEQVNQIKKTHLPLNYKKKSLRSLASPSTLDSTYIYPWDSTANLWDGNQYKAINTYDSNNNKISSLTKLLIAGEWKNAALESYTYDTNRNLTYYLYQLWDSTTSTWINGYYELKTYDTDNNLLIWAAQFWNGSNWYDGTNAIYTYDPNNNRTSFSQADWDSTTGTWAHVSYLTTYTYDSINNLITENQKAWDGTTYNAAVLNTNTYDTSNNQISELRQVWADTAFINANLNTYTYDSGNNKTNYLIQYWTGSSWENNEQYSYTYDSNHNLLSDTSKIWADTGWVTEFRDIFTYDANNNNISFLGQRFIGGGSWNNFFLELWTYDANNNMLTYTDQSWYFSWVNQYKYDYTYNINNDQTSESEYIWNETQWRGIDSTYNFFSIKSLVWPGDANNDLIVDNNDLLPIGLYYSESGIPRSAISNAWQADTCANWGIAEPNGSDIKHADCNGDGIIDANDTLAITMNFTLAHAMIAASPGGERSSDPDMYIVTSGSAYSPGDWVNAEIWLGSAIAPVSDLYGIAFNINYNSAFVQSGTGSIDYTSGWLGTIGTNAIKVSLVDPVSSIAYGGETRTDHTNASGYGKIATFKFQVKNTGTTADSMNLSISNYTAVNVSGSQLIFNPVPLVIGINTGIHEIENENAVLVSPNPYLDHTHISYTLTKTADVTIQIYNTVGQNIETLVNTKQSVGEYKYNFSAKEKGYSAGIYYVKITIDGKLSTRKIIEMK